MVSSMTQSISNGDKGLSWRVRVERMHQSSPGVTFAIRES